MIGLAGAGDLVATALARESRNRRAGELLAAGVPAAEIPARIGQAVEALESVPLLARALERAGVAAPVTSALGRLIAGELPLEDWVALVRATVPPPARWRATAAGLLATHVAARCSPKLALDAGAALSAAHERAHDGLVDAGAVPRLGHPHVLVPPAIARAMRRVALDARSPPARTRRRAARTPDPRASRRPRSVSSRA